MNIKLSLAVLLFHFVLQSHQLSTDADRRSDEITTIIEEQVVAKKNSKIVLHCKVKRSKKLEFVWFLNDEEIKKSKNVKIKTKRKAGTSVLTVQRVSKSGLYSCKVFKKSTLLQVQAFPVVVTSPCSVLTATSTEKRVSKSENSRLKLKCSSDCKAATYHWYRNGGELTNNVKVKTKRKTSTLTISKLKLSDAGSYTCRVLVESELLATHVTNVDVRPECDACESNVSYCYNSGKCCKDDHGGRYCECKKEWTGHRCDRRQYNN